MNQIQDTATAATPSYPWNVTLLSQRDVEAAIPINYVQGPGVSVSAACFGLERYDQYAFQQCVLNLLTTSFRRLVFDLYWDSRQQLWTFCPAEIPLPQGQGITNGTSINSTAQVVSVTSLSARQQLLQTLASTDTIIPPSGTLSSSSYSSVIPQTSSQIQTSDFPVQTTITVSTVNTSSTIALVYPPSPTTKDTDVLYSIGPYVCSRSLNVSTLLQTISDYFYMSDTTLKASIKYFILNLHVASDDLSPNSPAKNLSEAVQQNVAANFDSVFSNISNYLYTPSSLASEREDISSTWLSRNVTSPDLFYMATMPAPSDSDLLATENGWPCGSYIAGALNARVILSFGTIDSQLGGAEKFEAASENIFSANVLTNYDNVTISNTGAITEGCIFNATSPTIEAANSSWAFILDEGPLQPSSVQPVYSLPYSLSKCGLSPILNSMLDNRTADVDIQPYQEYAYSSIWSWASGEPAASNRTFDPRCAAFDSTYNGSWHAIECQSPRRAACRSNDNPFMWLISDEAAGYRSIESSCPENFIFEVPRTQVENRYLLQAYDQAGLDDGVAIYLNLNSIHVASCWVFGVNGTCPYQGDDASGSQVYIPTVAALIVLILAGLTLTVKLTTNRARSKRRRRVLDGWNYEGVPS